ncbi:MAG: chitobiase/beta-hexosaminidase C-terminal domain-containing protein [Kiritimatiellae bacterium]|nr:chitobiase/beta-hexosaminidase C-terminal domain-containing protein [Kiritimatiellia bacterium]
MAVTPEGGPYTAPVTITLTASTSGASIYYTTNGRVPDLSAARYDAPFALPAGVTELRARAFLDGAARGETNGLYNSLTPGRGTRIVAIADTRGSSSTPEIYVKTEVLNRIIDGILALDPKPAAVTVAGDSIREPDNIDGGYLQFTNCMARLVEAGIPYYNAIGNHEASQDPEWYRKWADAFTFPTNGPAGWEELVYYVDVGDVRLIALDAFTQGGLWQLADGYTFKVGFEQRQWLESVGGSNSPAPFDIVFSHGVAYPITVSHGPYLKDCLDQHPGERDAFLQALSDLRATAHFLGHEHLYIRRMIDTRYDPRLTRAVPHICNVSGASFHAELIDSPVPPESLILSNHNFTVVDVDPVTHEGAAFTYTEDGATVLDAVILKGKHADRTVPSSLVAAGVVWKYEDTGTDLGSAWRAAAYDDSGWAEGPSILGYGEPYIVTPISYGPTSANKHTTAYFRKHFTLADSLTDIVRLRLDVRYDDGYAAYLNGQEVARGSMPDGPIAYASLGTGHEGDVLTGADITAYAGLLVPGENVLAVEVHQGGPASSDLVMDLALVADTRWTPATVTAVAEGAGWKYRKGTAEASEPLTAWREPGFDDSGWAAGPAPFGYGNLSYGTELNDMTGRYACVFLRHPFQVDDPASVSRITVSASYDDGLLLWINGAEVARANMAGVPGSFCAYDAFATNWTGVFGVWSNVLTGAALPALVPGTNILAAQIFNVGHDSSDLFFDARLDVVAGTTLTADWDMDGMADAWEIGRFGSIGACSVDGDPDGDGLGNLAEFIAGTDPGAGDAFFDLAASLSGGQVVVTVPTVAATGPAYAGLTRYYSLEQSASPLTPAVWSPVPPYTNVLGTGEMLTYTNSGANAGAFYRARVWLAD